MKALILSLVLSVLVFGCGEEPTVENFKLQIAPSDPPIIFTTRTLTYVIGGETVEFEILGPWMQTGFAVVNNNDKAITIVSAEFRVTAPDGETRTAQLFQGIDLGQDTFGVFKAEKDINCDGVVNVDDDGATAPANCDLDEQNPSYNGSRYYIFDLMQGVTGEDLDPFRGGSFTFELRLEGWVGGPEDPEEGFFKVVLFTVGSNG